MAFGGQYPVWVDIDSCIYKQKKSYGVKQHSEQHIKVGTSSRNSHDFATVEIRHGKDESGGQIFKLYIDGRLMKSARLEAGAEELTIERNVPEVI